MMRRLLLMTLALLLIGAACSSSDLISGDIITTAPAGPSDPGRLAVLDDDGNVLTMDPDGSNRVEITDDGDTVRYFQPVWSPASQTLAWGQEGSSGFAVGMARVDGSDRTEVAVSGFPFYLNWSPDGERIGVLHNAADGAIDFELVDVADSAAGVVDSGVPYYFSWSPDGDALVVHVDGDRIEILDESSGPTDLGETTSNYYSPRWTTQGIFFLSPDGLTVRTPDLEERVLATAQGFVSINPNPKGTRVAVHILSDQPGGVTVGLTAQEQAEINAVSILDVESGELEVASEQLSIGSFWSPDGEKLLILSLSSLEGEVDIVLWEGAEAAVVATMQLPDSLVREALAFFDQYAQSWQIWSPDSSAFVLPGTREGESGIWVIPADGSDPIRVGDGDWAAWSHG